MSEPSGEAAATPRASFSTINPKLQIAWDSVSLGAIKKCPRYYQRTVLEGWRRRRGESLHLRYGILYHRALEVYDHKVFEGMSHDEAVCACMEDLAEGCQDQIVDEATGEITSVWWEPSAGLSEKMAAANTKTVPNLFRTVIWYLEEFGPNDPAKTVMLANGKPAVELSFRYEIGHTFSTGDEALHCGHLDRLVYLGDTSNKWVLDRKTTKSTIEGNSSWGYFEKFTPDNQMTGYVNGASICLDVAVQGVIIDAAQIAKGFSRFVRGQATRSAGMLAEWRAGAIFYMNLADQFAQANYWPMNDTACDHYGGCAMREICKKDPAVQEIFLKMDFAQFPWDPLKVRGDI